jgi:hypothetical protein
MTKKLNVKTYIKQNQELKKKIAEKYSELFRTFCKNDSIRAHQRGSKTQGDTNGPPQKTVYTALGKVGFITQRKR